MLCHVRQTKNKQPNKLDTEMSVAWTNFMQLKTFIATLWTQALSYQQAHTPF